MSRRRRCAHAKSGDAEEKTISGSPATLRRAGAEGRTRGLLRDADRRADAARRPVRRRCAREGIRHPLIRRARGPGTAAKSVGAPWVSARGRARPSSRRRHSLTLLPTPTFGVIIKKKILSGSNSSASAARETTSPLPSRPIL